MTFIRPAILCILFLAPAATHAQEIRVRAGEHRDFTRLVVRLPDGAEWDLKKEDGRAELTLPGFTGGFDLSRVFDLIPRTRLKNATATDEGLSLELDCLCDIETFIVQRRFLALDILDGPPLPASFQITEEQSPTIAARLPSSNFNFGDLLWENEAEETAATVLPSRPDAPQMGDDRVSPNSDFLAESRDRILQGFSEAASRGIITVDEFNPNALVNDEIETEEQVEIFDSSEELVVTNDNPLANVRITNSADLQTNHQNAAQAQKSTSCIPDKDLDIAAWGSEDGFSTRASELRADLFDPLDQIDEAQVIKLARHYLHYGFGVEARQLLDMSNSVARENPELLDMADILEFGYSRNPRVLHLGSHCPSSAALWSVLSAEILPEDQLVDVNAVVRHLKTLPRNLLELFAPDVSSRLVKYGDPAAAEIVLRATKRVPVEPGSKVGLVEGELAVAKGDSEEGMLQLESVSLDDSDYSAEALVKLMDESMNSDTDVAPELALLVESYAFEMADSEIGRDLHRAKVIANAKSNQFEKAFHHLLSANPSDESDDLLTLQRFVFSQLVEFPEDVSFVKEVFANIEMISADLGADLIVDIAERAMALGFFELSSRVLSKLDSVDATNESAVLGAKLQLTRGIPLASSVLLGKLAEEDVNILEEVSTNNFRRNGIDPNQSALERDFISADFDSELSGLDQVNPLDDGIKKQVATSDLPEINVDADMLVSVNSLLSEVESAREDLEAVLSRDRPGEP